MSKPSILLVEDHQIQRIGLKVSLENLACCNILGEATTGEMAISETQRLRPDLVLMDIGLPGIDGIEATWRIKNELPRTRVIMFTSHTTSEYVSSALGAGADGYCSKDISVDEIVNIIDSVMRGEVWLDPAIANVMVNARQTSKDPNGVALSEAELQLLKLIQTGMGNDELAMRLNMSSESLSKIMQNIIQRFVDKNATGKEPAAPLPLTESANSNQWLRAFVDNLNEDRIFCDKYLIEGLLGSGGMGSVFKARHLYIDRTVALKLLWREAIEDRFSLRNFQREAMAIANVQHKNIVGIYDFGISPKQEPYMVMEFIDGVSLADILKREGRLPTRRVINITLQICAGLAEAHTRGLIHCDLKPSNILIINPGGAETVKLVDFGLAQVVPRETSTQSKLTEKNFVCGTPSYMSPEQCVSGQLDGRSDIYSLGCIMHEALTGIEVFQGNTALETFANQLKMIPPPISSVTATENFPPVLEKCVSEMLAKDPAARPQTVTQVSDMLLAALEQCAPVTH